MQCLVIQHDRSPPGERSSKGRLHNMDRQGSSESVKALDGKTNSWGQLWKCEIILFDDAWIIEKVFCYIIIYNVISDLDQAWPSNRKPWRHIPHVSSKLETKLHGVMGVIVTLDGLTCTLLLSPRACAPEVEVGRDDGCMGPRWDDWELAQMSISETLKSVRSWICPCGHR